MEPAEAAVEVEECVVLGRQEVGRILQSIVGGVVGTQSHLKVVPWDSAVISPGKVG